MSAAFTHFTSEPLTDDEAAVVRACASGMRFHRRICYWNAYRLVAADRSGRLRYVEGSVACTLISGAAVSLHHAWIALDGKVIDPTLRLDRHESATLHRPVWRDRVAGAIPPRATTGGAHSRCATWRR